MATQVKQASHYLVHAEPWEQPFEVETMSIVWDFAITAELRGYDCRAFVVFTDGTEQEVEL
jgi:hypothetical protein